MILDSGEYIDYYRDREGELKNGLKSIDQSMTMKIFHCISYVDDNKSKVYVIANNGEDKRGFMVI